MSDENNNVDESLVLPVLQKIPLFSGLNDELHREIIQQIVLMYFPEGYQLFSEGDEGDALYIIKNGEVEIFHPTEEGLPDNRVATLKDRDFFGEMALVSELPRNASARSLSDSEIFILSKENFKTLLNTNSVLAEHVSATMVDRINENDQNNR